MVKDCGSKHTIIKHRTPRRGGARPERSRRMPPPARTSAARQFAPAHRNLGELCSPTRVLSEVEGGRPGLCGRRVIPIGAMIAKTLPLQCRHAPRLSPAGLTHDIGSDSISRSGPATGSNAFFRACPNPRCSLQNPPHAFWDRTNILLFSGVAVFRGLDYASTRNFLARGREEILIPDDIVNNSAAFASLEAAATLTSVGLSYWMHRADHHKVERWISIVHIGVTGFGVVRNYSLKSKHYGPVSRPTRSTKLGSCAEPAYTVGEPSQEIFHDPVLSPPHALCLLRFSQHPHQSGRTNADRFQFNRRHPDRASDRVGDVTCINCSVYVRGQASPVTSPPSTEASLRSQGRDRGRRHCDRRQCPGRKRRPGGRRPDRDWRHRAPRPTGHRGRRRDFRRRRRRLGFSDLPAALCRSSAALSR